jgi:DNA-binding NarL/FixJ family response regulator
VSRAAGVFAAFAAQNIAPILCTGGTSRALDYFARRLDIRDPLRQPGYRPNVHRRGMRPLRLLLVDDHRLVRQGLRKLIEGRDEWQVVAEAGDGREAVALAEQHRPDVAVIDVSMPCLNGIEAVRQITARAPRTRVLVLSMYDDEAYVTQVLRAGAAGYILKDSAEADLVQAITAVSEWKAFFSSAIARVMLEDYVRQLASSSIVDRYDSLTEREREVFQLIAEGRSNKEIASLLFVSPSTVDTHRGHIMEKLEVHSAAEIVLYAVRRGVIR